MHGKDDCGNKAKKSIKRKITQNNNKEKKKNSNIADEVQGSYPCSSSEFLFHSSPDIPHVINCVKYGIMYRDFSIHFEQLWLYFYGVTYRMDTDRLPRHWIILNSFRGIETFRRIKYLEMNETREKRIKYYVW